MITDEVPEGLLSLPHGYGFTYPNYKESEIFFENNKQKL